MRAVLLLLSIALVACAPGRAAPGDPAALPPARVALPARLAIPALGVDARIAPVELTPDGAIAPPGTPGEVAWYADGARPGERGNALLAGHNAVAGRAGAFAGLARLRPGDRLVVTTSQQARFPYVVEWLRTYPADAPAPPEVVAPTDEPVLTIIAPTGQPDPRGDYPQRLVVRARALTG